MHIFKVDYLKESFLKYNNMADQKNQTENSTLLTGTTPKVTGIGGISFFSDNPKETREWYAKNLGLDINEHGYFSFEFRNVNKPEKLALSHGIFLKKEVNISRLQKRNL